MNCPWTVKQMDVKHDKYNLKLIDCSNGNCPAHVKGFPTMQRGDTIHTGYLSQEKINEIF